MTGLARWFRRKRRQAQAVQEAQPLTSLLPEYPVTVTCPCGQVTHHVQGCPAVPQLVPFRYANAQPLFRPLFALRDKRPKR